MITTQKIRMPVDISMTILSVILMGGTVLDGVLFASTTLSKQVVTGTSSDVQHTSVDVQRIAVGERSRTDTVVIAITGIHGNFYSNPFYFNFGDTLNRGGIDLWAREPVKIWSEAEYFHNKPPAMRV